VYKLGRDDRLRPHTEHVSHQTRSRHTLPLFVGPSLRSEHSPGQNTYLGMKRSVIASEPKPFTCKNGGLPSSHSYEATYKHWLRAKSSRAIRRIRKIAWIKLKQVLAMVILESGQRKIARNRSKTLIEDEDRLAQRKADIFKTRCPSETHACPDPTAASMRPQG
jgi:hypothetical protein